MDHSAINPRQPTELAGREAIRRLADLGLTDEIIARAALRADADALMCTDLDPANMEGMLRWGRLVRYLREELVPLGWTPDNSKNFCRIVSPDNSFAIVVSSGDENTAVPGATPSTKYPKGITTVEAVATNEWTLFDLFEDDGAAPNGPREATLLSKEIPSEREDQPSVPVWYLLFRVVADELHLELSFPDDTDHAAQESNGSKRGVWINSWAERIILPGIDRGDVVQELPEDKDGEDYDFAVTPR